MDAMDKQLPDNHQNIVDRFIASCQADERIVAAFLGGSYARNGADQFSDLDLYFVTTDEAYQDFLAERESFIRRLGEPLFLGDFGATNGYFIIYSNGSETEIWFGRESKFKDIHEGPYKVLVDKKNILAGEVFPQHVADPAKQMETLRHQIDWFWHDLSHFIKAMGRRQLWFAYGELEVLRNICINLARLRYNFSDAYVGEEPYFKVEQVLPVEQLSPLQFTYCPMEYKALLQAALVLFRFYQNVASVLAEAHGIKYQTELERMMLGQLQELGNKGLS
jgi:predicted nucleotidyltransferase